MPNPKNCLLFVAADSGRLSLSSAAGKLSDCYKDVCTVSDITEMGGVPALSING